MEIIKVKTIEYLMSIAKILNNQYTPYIVIFSQNYV